MLYNTKITMENYKIFNFIDKNILIKKKRGRIVKLISTKCIVNVWVKKCNVGLLYF